ncbi:MAG TPA: gamma-glutamyl-gamma-aminobutyrate hydrolase family protein, partial [Pyrinomonadaceae bacterium]|nr:gamma-glutamyl-gamma-aminobutyrate hydrolase family protein [Pyrinomonadaceae bacterium]
MRKRPVIGLAMRLEIDSNRFYLGRDYSEALAGLGAVPFHMSLIPDPDYVSEIMDLVDGVLLPGSDTD